LETAEEVEALTATYAPDWIGQFRVPRVEAKEYFPRGGLFKLIPTGFFLVVSPVLSLVFCFWAAV